MGAAHIWREGEMVEYVESLPRAGRSQYSICDFSSASGKSVSVVLEVKTALEDEHSEFVRIQAVEGVWLLKPDW